MRGYFSESASLKAPRQRDEISETLDFDVYIFALRSIGGKKPKRNPRNDRQPASNRINTALKISAPVLYTSFTPT